LELNVCYGFSQVNWPKAEPANAHSKKTNVLIAVFSIYSRKMPYWKTRITDYADSTAYLQTQGNATSCVNVESPVLFSMDAKASFMYQIVFNEISAAEMTRIPKELQLELLAEFQFLPDDLDSLDSKAFGVIEREGKRLYRYRTNDYRIYFERSPEGVLVHRVLHKNTIRDFLFRSKLPMGEDEQLQENASFWSLIEEGEQKKK
jgi:mRNA-degrading endonuclease RelE of RelBE toxin-antitoxin system